MPNQLVLDNRPIKKKKKSLAKRFNYSAVLGLSIGALFMMVPFLWALSVSLQGPGLAYVMPPHFFKAPYFFSNYPTVFESANFLQYALNSLFIAGVCIVGNLISNSFVGFGIAKYKFKGSQALFFSALCTMMIPGNIMNIPHYIMWHMVGALDTYFPLTVGAFFGTAFNIFLMRQCFLGLPNELYEAAMIDGAHPLKIFFKVYMPLAKPMLATMGVNTFMGCWNNMFGPLIYITTKSKYTLAIGLLYIKGAFEYNLELLMASSIMAMLPVLFVYFFAQKYFVQGLVSAGIKG